MKWPVCALFTALLASSAGADAPHPLAYLASVEGTCSSMIVADVDQTAKCPAVVLNTAYADNYSSFKLITSDGLVICFFGYDHAAQGDVAHLTVSRILITPPPVDAPGDTLVDLTRKAEKATRDLKASGDCEYTNPALPDTHINCTATADGQSYSFKFHQTSFKIIG